MIPRWMLLRWLFGFSLYLLLLLLSGCSCDDRDTRGVKVAGNDYLTVDDDDDCLDADGDSHSARDETDCPDGDDYCDLDPDNWREEDCGIAATNCRDLDGDGRDAYDKTSCPAGDDACDTDPDNWTSGACLACVDLDGDGFRAGCDIDSDCDDSLATGGGCSTGCSDYYADLDGDAYGDPAQAAPACVPPDGFVVDNSDCDPTDPNHWADCGDCTDSDGDGYGEYCDLGPDCDDRTPVAADCREDCKPFFADFDLDGHGYLYSFIAACHIYPGVVTSYDDCAPSDPAHWADCDVCGDGDGDGYGDACDLGPDCDDDPATGPSCFDGCGTFFVDLDGDGYGGPAALNTGCAPLPGGADNDLDCDDSLATGPSCFDGCGTFFVDNDGDGHGGTTVSNVGCVALPGGADNDLDCDDSLATGPSCFDSCSSFYKDVDGDGYGDSAGPASACSEPAGYVADDSDCAPTDAAHWADCGACADADLDDYGASCDLGPDCDDKPATGPSCHSDCSVYYSDADGDGYGDPAVFRNACLQPTGYVADDSDCDPTDPAHWSDCGACTDADGDDYGAACDLGPDCDDADGDNWVSCATCIDVDADGYSYFCDAYVSHLGPDCDDADAENWLSCSTCVDNDSDGYFKTCDLYTTRSGPDCDDADLNNWDKCSTCLDADADLFYAECNTYVTISGPDCSPNDDAHWSDCGLCIDGDGDDYGVDCDLGTDCNDADGAVHSGVSETPEDGIDQDCDGYDLRVTAAVTTYVDSADPGCSDANIGTVSTPNCTIQAAIDLTPAGEPIFVAGGSYSRITVTKKVRLYGGYLPGAIWTRVGGAASRIERKNWYYPAVLIDSGGSLEMNLFTITGDGDINKDYASILRNEGFALLKNIHIRATVYMHTDFIRFNGILNLGTLIFNSGSIRANVAGNGSDFSAFRNHGGKLFVINSIFLPSSATFYANGINNTENGIATVVNNRIYAGVDTLNTEGVRSYTTGGIRKERAYVINNTIDGGNGDTSSAIMGGNYYLLSNTLWGPDQQNILGGGINSIITINSCTWTGCLNASGNLSVDPQYINPAGADFHLSPSSPMIDAGIDPTPYVNHIARPYLYYDFEGDRRGIDGDGNVAPQWDIGPDEYTP